ncbi:MAG: hypothetical protein AAGF56_07905 [Pseudomonadota bacterium]
MHRLIWVLAVAVVASGVWLWGLGGSEHVARLAAEGQREAQQAMAGALRALRTGQPGAIVTLLTLSFAYGFFHAAGPGHGKLVIGGYGIAERVPLVRLSVLALASSVAQAVTAIAFVFVAFAVLDWGRQQMVGTAEQVFAPTSFGLIGLVGFWLAVRGIRRFATLRTVHAENQAQHRHDTHADHTCHTCGHKHGPSLSEAASVHSVRDAMLVIGSVAVRPCTGAIFVLILTWQMGIPAAGVAAALAMAFGTACVTVSVALAAVSLRESAFMRLQGSAALRATAALELLAGLVIAAVSLQLVLSAI